jgi:pimeloyl-ACP methyl ester carboxylesterase
LTPSAQDEFGLLHENAEEFGIPWADQPDVRREVVVVSPSPDGRRLSALVWGVAEPEIVLLHGGAQNAHTWDTVALALDRPLVAIDLPNHGHSDTRSDGPLSAAENAADVEVAVRALAPDARMVVGMSLGGLTAIALTSRAPSLVRKLALVDITPGVGTEQAAHVREFVSGPESFGSFDEMLQRAIAFEPARSVMSLRRGVLHNSVQRDDGRWVWRHHRTPAPGAAASVTPDFGYLWDDVSRLRVPLLLIRGTEVGTCVDDDAVAELRRRQPGARVEKVEGAGHSVQGHRPVELARLLAEFVA